MIDRRYAPESEEQMKQYFKRIGWRIIPLCVMVALLIASGSAYAQTSKKGEEDTEPAIIVDVQTTPSPTAALEEPMVTTTQVPFSVPGNGAVLDDIEDGSKEFYTITTANNNTFFLVVDKASSVQNAYLLAKVDEDDLKEFIPGYVEASPEPEPTPAVVIQRPTALPTASTIEVTEAEPEETQTGSYLAIGIIVIIAVAGLYYFKIYKPKKEADEEEMEGMEYDDSRDGRENE